MLITFRVIASSIGLLPLLTTAQVVVNTTPAAPAPTTAPGNCVKNGVHMITVRGLSEGLPNGDIQPLVDAISKRIPGSDSTGVPYSASNTVPPYMVSVDQGAAMTINYIETYAKSCPNSKIVLLGYSQGAQAAMDALCGTSSAGYVPSLPLNVTYAKYITAIVMMGDPSFVYPQTYDYGSATRSGAFPRLNTQPCQTYAHYMRSYCDATDRFCADNGVQGSEDVHHAYFVKYDSNAVDFVQGHWNGSLSRT